MTGGWWIFAWMNAAWFLDDFATAAERSWSWWPALLQTQHTFTSATTVALIALFSFSRAVSRAEVCTCGHAMAKHLHVFLGGDGREYSSCTLCPCRLFRRAVA